MEAVRDDDRFAIRIRCAFVALGLLATAPALTVSLVVNWGTADVPWMFLFLFLTLLLMPFCMFLVWVKTLTLSVVCGVSLLALAVWAQVGWWTAQEQEGLAFIAQTFFGHLIAWGGGLADRVLRWYRHRELAC